MLRAGSGAGGSPAALSSARALRASRAPLHSVTEEEEEKEEEEGGGEEEEEEEEGANGWEDDGEGYPEPSLREEEGGGGASANGPFAHHPLFVHAGSAHFDVENPLSGLRAHRSHVHAKALAAKSTRVMHSPSVGARGGGGGGGGGGGRVDGRSAAPALSRSTRIMQQYMPEKMAAGAGARLGVGVGWWENNPLRAQGRGSEPDAAVAGESVGATPPPSLRHSPSGSVGAAPLSFRRSPGGGGGYVPAEMEEGAGVRLGVGAGGVNPLRTARVSPITAPEQVGGAGPLGAHSYMPAEMEEGADARLGVGTGWGENPLRAGVRFSPPSLEQGGAGPLGAHSYMPAEMEEGADARLGVGTGWGENPLRAAASYAAARRGSASRLTSPPPRPSVEVPAHSYLDSLISHAAAGLFSLAPSSPRRHSPLTSAPPDMALIATGAQEAGGSRRMLVGVNPMLSSAGAARLGASPPPRRAHAAAHEVHYSVALPEQPAQRGPARGASVRHHMQGAVARGRERFAGGDVR